MSTRCVFVGNIPYDATEEQLIQICEEVGPVVSFRLVIDKETGKPKGYGFCEFKDEETALSARRNLQGYEINGRQLRVDFAENDKSADRNREQGRGGPGFTSTTDAQRKQGSVRDPSLNQPVGIGAAVAAAVVMAGALGAPQVASFSGSGGQVGCDPLTSYLAGMSKSQLYEIISQMKEFIHQNQPQSRHILTANPQLTKALFQAEIILGLVRPPQVMPNVLLQRPNMQNLSKPQFQMYGQHDPSAQFPRQPLQSQTLPLPKLPQQTPLHQVQGRVVPPQMLSQVQLESCPQTMSMQSLLQPPVPPPPQLQPQGMVAEAPQPSSLQQQPGVSSSQHLNLSLMQHPQPPKMNQVQPSGFAFQSSPFLQQPPFPQTLFQQSVGLPQSSSGLPFQTQVPPPLSSTHQPPQQPVHLSRAGAELNGDNISTSQSGGVGSQLVGPSPPTAWRNHVQPSLNGGGEIMPPLPMTGPMNPTTSTAMAMPSMLSSNEVSYSTGMNVNGSGNPSEAVTAPALTVPQGFSEPMQQKPQQPQLQIPQELEAQKELLQQVMNLTAEQINSLPPEQRDQVIQLQKTLRGQ